jgi:hypothetical protein
VDIKSPEERSKNMSKIKNERTKPEMFIRTMLYRHGLRFRVNYSELPESLICISSDKRQQYSFTAVTGIATPDVNMLILPIQSGILASQA